jgi:hypothetical protein
MLSLATAQEGSGIPLYGYSALFSVTVSMIPWFKCYLTDIDLI